MITIFSDNGEAYSDGDPLTDGPWAIGGESNCLHKQYTNTQKKHGNIGLWLETTDASGSTIYLRGDFGQQAFGEEITVEAWFYDTGSYNYYEENSLYISNHSYLSGAHMGAVGNYRPQCGSDYYCIGAWKSTGIPRSVGWHIFKIIVKADGAVDFYVDGTKSAYNYGAGFFSGVHYIFIVVRRGEAFFDDILVESRPAVAGASMASKLISAGLI